jgi:hypothetical protein
MVTVEVTGVLVGVFIAVGRGVLVDVSKGLIVFVGTGIPVTDAHPESINPIDETI